MGISRRAGLFAAAAAMVAGSIPMGGHAALAGWCDGTYTGSGTCSLVYGGQAFGVYGNATAPSSPSLFVEIVEPTTNTRLAFCWASATGTRASCEAGSWLMEPLFGMPAGVVLLCKVTGNVSGTFGCVSQTF